MKAFLSYSSKDQIFVKAVAKQLGRQYCLCDKFSFSTGDELKITIQKCLDQTGLFILFASKDSLSSIWVNFETDEAWHRMLGKQISKSLVYIIDKDVQIEDIPEWLRRTLVQKNVVAHSIARDIRFHINELLRDRRHSYFVGRATESNQLEEILTPTDGASPPHVFIIYGLPGVGRRTLIRHAISNILNFRKVIEIRLEEGDSINDICAKTADIIEPYSNRAEFTRIFKKICDLTPDRALERTINNFRTLSEGGELPVLVDEGGFLDNEGYIQTPVLDLLQEVTPNDTMYLAFVSHRQPQRSIIIIPALKLHPLPASDTKRLIQRLCNEQEVKIDPNDLTDIAEYVAGYPPSAYFAIKQVKDYGIELVVNQKKWLIQFRTSVFLRHIQDLKLKNLEKSVLKLLACVSPLPLPAIVSFLDTSLETAYKVLIRLIDLSLVIPDDTGLYRISEPIKEAATRMYGFLLEQEQYTKIATAIEKYLKLSSVSDRQLELNRILFRIERLGGVLNEPDKLINLASDLIKLTKDYYHARGYKESVMYGEWVVTERPNSIIARSYLIRSLIQLERWKDAEYQLKELEKFSHRKEVHFLRGFLERHRDDFKKAIGEYLESIKLGRKDAAIERELAQCYFMAGDIETANEHIQKAIKQHGDNRYLVDLWIRIAIKLGDREQANKALQRLEIIDRHQFYLYRKSRFELQFGNIGGAREAIQEAISSDDGKKPRFSFMVQAALCEIILQENLNKANQYLSILDSSFSGIRRDVRIGLRCRLNISYRKYSEALSLSDGIKDKTSRNYRVIRYDIIRGLLQEAIITTEKKIAYEEELQLLVEDLGPEPKFDLLEFD